MVVSYSCEKISTPSKFEAILWDKLQILPFLNHGSSFFLTSQVSQSRQRKVLIIQIKIGKTNTALLWNKVRWKLLFNPFFLSLLESSSLQRKCTWAEQKGHEQATSHLQCDHGNLTLAVIACGLSVFTGLFHMIPQVFPQYFFFAVGTKTGKLLKLAFIF